MPSHPDAPVLQAQVDRLRGLPIGAKSLACPILDCYATGTSLAQYEAESG